ncbi:response regulator [Vibrio crassostreae]|uniref:response regulator n=1 Tax=Vibrio crassostreae TaxID=246167 RepID=UPI00104EFF31|nr:response regulator [Vibrio crassostreae]TCV11253.1 response regulator receiver domain-containing protein [Vibrio crassostreae]TWD64085.1 response regulator receiver domain-containing protein [Vibrio crassostreae]
MQEVAIEESGFVYTSFEFLVENASVIFSGIGVAAMGGIYKLSQGKKDNQNTETTNKNSITNNIQIDVNSQSKETKEAQESLSSPLSDSRVREIKNNTKILFIDDDTRFKVVKILTKSGWVNTKLVKDIDSLDCHNVLDANIIFVDVQGVGVELNFKEEGLGLAAALKEKYPDKKIIIYSAEQKGDRFHEALRKVDDFLAKDVDPYQFTSLVEKFSGI